MYLLSLIDIGRGRRHRGRGVNAELDELRSLGANARQSPTTIEERSAHKLAVF